MSFSPMSAKNQSRHSNSFSQQHKVQGAVTDGTNPLPGVTIALKNKKNNAAISDYSGRFSLSCSPYDTLVVSYIGFKTALVPIMARSVVDIKLSYDTTTLQEVLVNAGYYSVKESERTGSIARITSKDIESQPVTNVLAAMQGRMAGVSITQTTGVPGSGFDIKIRGQNSLRSDANAPLYIIDGVPYSSDPIGYNQTSTTLPNITSPLNSISPDSIESIEILKDADATSIYGSRGANGVVLITTKKGKTGKTSVTLKASTGAGTVARFMKLMNTQQYLDMRRQAFINDGIPYRASDYDINGTWDQNRYTDWQKELIGGTALINSFQGSISGGSDKTQFLISANYHTESSVFKGDFPYKKGGGQFNLNHTSENNKFRLNFTFGYTAQDNQQPAFDFTYDARSLAPNAPELYSSDGSLNWENGTWDNPLRNLNAEYKSKTNDFISNLMLSYDILPGLTVKTSAGYSNLNTVETRTSPSTIYNPSYNINSSFSSIYFNNTKRSSWIAEPQISFTKEWEIGKFDMLLGGTFQNQKTDRLYQSGDGFSSNSLIYSLSAASFQTVLLDDQTIYKYQAFFGRLNYNYKQRYIINFTARRDGSSRFSPENQFSNFGAVGAAWLFSNENFMKESGWLSFGKLRFSYGTTGSDQIGDYQFLNTYNLTAANYDGTVGIAPSRLYNKDFGWETNKKLEAAIETGFLNDRLFLTAAWYRNRSSNQLTGVPLPGTTGFTTLLSNLAAVVENKGLELTLRTVNFSSRTFNWTTSFNLTFAENKLLAFPNLESSSYSQQYRVGQPLNIKLLYKFSSVDSQTGLYQFEDLNNDGKISFPDDQQIISDMNPKYYGGMQNQLTYKKWKLDFLFQFVNQKNISYPMSPAGTMSNQSIELVNSWQQQGDKFQYQLYTTGSNSAAVNANNLFSKSDAAVEDASFIRLKNISLSYDLPLMLKETRCRVMIQGQNLLTFTKYKNGDPEFITHGYLPPLKIITAGIQLKF
ncbi:SusC/RagA family TonB-linked outer membrane protein [Flavobacterium johnsoniae]|uniref:SusC/RagA family TonB-linked outer membrane protein n=1 Tax=Flavobacterium johnsoniae TaxID=986 RepID=UPI003D997F1C